MQLEWKRICRLRMNDDVSNARLCANHFSVSDYKYTSSRNILKKRVVPSVHIDSPTLLPCYDRQHNEFSLDSGNKDPQLQTAYKQEESMVNLTHEGNKMREEDQSYNNEYSILNSVVCKTEQVESEKDTESCCDTFKTEIKEEDLNDNETIHVCELCDKIFVHKTDFINHQNNDACRNQNKLIKTEIKIEIGTDDSCEGIKTEVSDDEYGENPRIMRENDENSSGNCPQIKTELDLIDSSSIGNEDNPQEAELSEDPGKERCTCLRRDEVIKQSKNHPEPVGPQDQNMSLTCKFCSKTFTYNLSLFIHERSHKKNKTYQCATCSKSFVQKCHLVRHIRIHTKEKPFRCEECSKCFSQTSHLIDHRKVHTGEKPYQCKICTMSFSQKTHFVEHLRIHAGMKLYRCKVCSKSFSRRYYCGKHEMNCGK